MKKKGSLFLTHLDVDAVYIEGDKDLIKEFKGYRPRKSLIRKTLQETENFIKSIGWYPNSDIGRLWLCDVLYVSLRNCIYCKNALSGFYEFGYENALDLLSLPVKTRAAMLCLREGKYLYRKSVLDRSINIPSELFAECGGAILNQSVKFTAGGRTTWNSKWRRDYWGERLIERAILNGEYYDANFLEKIKNHNYNKIKLKRDVSNIIKDKL
jgi:hypothetical protein